MKLKKKGLNKKIFIIIVLILVSAGYAGKRLYQTYRDNALLQAEMKSTYDYDAMVERYQGYPDSVLVKSDQPRVAFNEAYHSPDGYYYISPVFQHDKSELKKHTPTMASDLVWYRYGFTSDQQKVYFTFDFPEHGIYCEGCFDGWPYNNGFANVTGQWISGGHYKDRVFKRGLPRLWNLTAGIVIRDPRYYFVSPEPAYPMEKDESIDATVTTLLRTKIGQEVEIDDRYGETKVQVKRLDDLKCGKYSCLYFKTIGGEGTEYALLDKKSYVVMFTYEHTGPVFDLFPRIVGSYSEGIDKSITHGRFPRVTSLDGYEVIPE